jgi:hypothetical protein
MIASRALIPAIFSPSLLIDLWIKFSRRISTSENKFLFDSFLKGIINPLSIYCLIECVGIPERADVVLRADAGVVKDFSAQNRADTICLDKFWISGDLPVQLHFPSKIQSIIKTAIVPKQPPPNFQAPYPESNPLKRLFMIIVVLLDSVTNDNTLLVHISFIMIICYYQSGFRLSYSLYYIE